MRHRAALLLALIVGAVVPAIARAQSCAWTKDNVTYSSTPFVYTATNFSPPSIDFTGTKTGDLLTPLQAVTVTSPVVGFINCTTPGAGGGNVNQEFAGVGTFENASASFITNIPGVGLRIYSGPKGPFEGGGSNIQWPTTPSLPGGFALPAQITLYMQLVRTTATATTSGGVLSGELGRMTPWGGTRPGVSFVFGAPIPVKPVFPTCAVVQKSIGVPLGSVELNKFSGVDSTAGGTASFNIALTCGGGSAGTSVDAYITLSDPTSPGNRSNVLSLTAASTATGVGIQLRNGENKLVGFGPDSDVAGNLNQWLVQSSIGVGNRSFNVPMTARYVQTGARITPGSANGIATFTMSYQ